MTLTLPALHRLARRWCPPKARWDRIIARPRAAWGSAHEIAHALLSTPSERTRRDYGLCDVGDCRCVDERCAVVELAAMAISARLCLTIGRPDLIAQEIGATDGYAEFSVDPYLQRANALLAERRLLRIPRTVAGLERLLRSRLS